MEYQARDVLRKRGFVVVRAAASKGPADLIALRGDAVLLVQVKAVRGRLGEAERERALAALRRVPAPKGCRRELWVWSQDRRRWERWSV